jgi:hypothetical protein
MDLEAVPIEYENGNQHRDRQERLDPQDDLRRTTIREEPVRVEHQYDPEEQQCADFEG